MELIQLIPEVWGPPALLDLRRWSQEVSGDQTWLENPVVNDI